MRSESQGSAPELPAQLAGLFDSVVSMEFLREYWQRGPVLACADREQLASIGFDSDTVERLLRRASSSESSRLHVITGGRAVPSPPEAAHGAGGRSVLGAGRSAYSKPILLTRVDTLAASIADVCKSLERRLVSAQVLLSSPVSANLYTSPSGCAGLLPHYDNHDVFIVQLDGEKLWHVHEPVDRFPIERDVNDRRREALPPLLLEATLRAADVLYIPRGFIHEASTETHASIHLTLAVNPRTWLDVLSRAAVRSASLREALPAGGAGDPELVRSGLTSRLTALAAQMSDPDGVYEITQELASDGPRVGAPSNRPLRLDSVVVRRPDAYLSLELREATVYLRAGGCQLTSSLQMQPAFSFVSERTRFTSAELPDLLPDEGKLQLVRELIAAGVLDIVDP